MPTDGGRVSAMALNHARIGSVLENKVIPALTAIYARLTAAVTDTMTDKLMMKTGRKPIPAAIARMVNPVVNKKPMNEVYTAISRMNIRTGGMMLSTKMVTEMLTKYELDL
ncbi:hypothetical protein OGATHE_002413 [Ogataea polymorpha]|uniref:Uncharacterized protein n=1 Tax=Ogataea polymorpha TaxID=460523 RepID=A0A9P8T878_9ASCO|nr:hypothetical protein KL904_005378 [Ogataea polymorpha]KAG7938514.1 hypothetical protein KL934_001088 [Ogataea polymorpha]KAH3669601.1 hypothetical protein OGATHE_002413 [Ogataea polymorpha]